MGQLRALEVLGALHTTEEVLREVRAGAAKGFPEWVPVAQAVDEGRVKVHPADLRPMEGFTLDAGELSVLRLAAKERLPAVVVDDRAAIRAARNLGLFPKSTAFVLLENVREGRLSSDEFKRLLPRLVAEGYHLGAPLYSFLMEAADRL